MSMVLQWFLVSKTIGSNGFPIVRQKLTLSKRYGHHKLSTWWFFRGGTQILWQRTQIFILGPFFMLDGLDSSNLAGSGLVQSGGCHWAHQISGSCWFYLIFCQFGVLRAQKLIKMCTKMLVFSVANSRKCTLWTEKSVSWDKWNWDPSPPFEVFRKFISFGSLTRP